jgi:glycosyltransferase involved in cell wall biosynthesis
VRISLIIPAYNEERLLVGTLRQVNHALTAFAMRGWQTELIVCDNNSTDRTAELARAAGAEVVFEPVNQIGRARNRGAEAATGEWLVFVDADSQPTKELFAAVADQIEAGQCLAGGCEVKLEGNHSVGRAITGLWNWISRTFNLLAGSFIFCEAAAFREVGGFSLELYAGEELDLSQRLKRLARQRGKRVVLLRGHALLTSARKVELYQLREHAWFVAKVILRRRKTLCDPKACYAWYDGRR